MRRLLVLGKGGLESRLPPVTRHGARGERHVCDLLGRLHSERTPVLVLQEGLVLEGARRYCSGERSHVAPDAEVGTPLHPLGRSGLFLCWRETRPEPPPRPHSPGAAPRQLLASHTCAPRPWWQRREVRGL